MKIKLICMGIMIALTAPCSFASFTQDVSAGNTADNEIIDDPNQAQNVYGTITNSIVNGGLQHIYSGGVANGMNNQQGTQTVDSLGLIANSALNGASANLFISGTASSIAINAGNMDILNGGVAINTLVTGSSSVLNNRFGDDYNTIISSGGVLNTGSLNQPGEVNTAQSFNAVIKAGGTQNVQNGGVSNGSQVQQGGTLVVQANYHTIDTTPGAVEGIANDSIVYGSMENRGGIDNGTVVKNGGSYTSGYNLSTDENNRNISVSNGLLVEQGGYAELGGYSAISDMTVAGIAISRDQSSLNDSVITSTGELTVEDGTHANNITNNGVLNIKAVDGNSGEETQPTITGDVITNAGATTFVWAHADTSSANFTVAGNLFFDGSHDVTLPDHGFKPQSYQLNSLDMQGGNVFLDPGNYSQLTIGTLSGMGNFYLNTSIGEMKGSTLNITGTDSGNFNVYATDSGVSPANDGPLRVVTANGGTAEFTLANEGGVVDAGTYEYYLVADGKGNWDLSTVAEPPDPVDPVDPIDPPVPPAPPAPPEPTYTPSTSAVMSMAVTAPIINDVEMHTVRDRIDSVRDISHDLNVWARYIGSKESVNNDAARFDMNINGIMMGADVNKDFTDSHLTLGGFMGYTNSDVDFDREGSGDVDSWSTGAYLDWMNSSGYYIDSIVKVNRFSNDVNARMTSGAAADGDYNQNGFSGHLEAGKYFYFEHSFVAPYVAVTGFTTDNSSYDLSNGMKANVDNVNSLFAESGVNFGTTFNTRSAVLKPYLKLAVADELVDDNSVQVNDDKLGNDMSGVMGVYEAGINAQVTKTLSVGASVQYNHSSKMESPFIVNAGFSLQL